MTHWKENWGAGGEDERGALNFNPSSVTNSHATLGKSPFPSLGLSFPAPKGICLATSPSIPSLLREPMATHAQTALVRTLAMSRPWVVQNPLLY